MTAQTVWNVLLGSSGLVAIFACVYYLLQIKINRSALMASKHRITVDFLNEWREPTFKESQAYVLETIARKCFEGQKEFVQKGYRNLEQQDKLHVTRVSYFLDYLGNLIAVNALDQRLVLTMIARPIIDHWEILRPLIYTERQNRSTGTQETSVKGTPYIENYQGGFEHLYMLAREFTQEKALDKMRRDSRMRGAPPIIAPGSWD